MRRIFIAVNLPRAVKERAAKIRKKWRNLPVRWTKPKNLHITLAFIGYVDEEKLAEIITRTRRVAQKYVPFSLTLTNATVGPPRRARMIWLNGGKSKPLAALKDELERSLADFQKKSMRRYKEFKFHITLARFDTKEWNQIPEKERFVSEETRAVFRVRSIEVMESKLKKSGAEYAIVEKIALSMR